MCICILNGLLHIKRNERLGIPHKIYQCLIIKNKLANKPIIFQCVNSNYNKNKY